MPISVGELFTAAGAVSSGVVRWGVQVSPTEPGVYCVARTADPNAAVVNAPAYIPSASAYATLLTARPHLSVDGGPATPSSLAKRLGQFWIPNEPVLYIGLAGSSLRKRISQYYATRLGARSPHAGGWWLKTLADLGDLYVHFAACDDVDQRERVMLQAFADTVLPEHRTALFDQERIAPFANVKVANGLYKRHKLQHYKSDPQGTGVAVTLPAVPATAPASMTPTQAPPVVSPDVAASGEFDVVVYSQPVTDKDRNRSNIRIPSASKYAFPSTACTVQVVFDGVRTEVAWRPNGSRSGTLGVGVDVMRSLRERDERIRIGVVGGTYFLLRK